MNILRHKPEDGPQPLPMRPFRTDAATVGLPPLAPEASVAPAVRGLHGVHADVALVVIEAESDEAVAEMAAASATYVGGLDYQPRHAKASAGSAVSA